MTSNSKTTNSKTSSYETTEANLQIRQILPSDEAEVCRLVALLPEDSKKWSQRIDRRWIQGELASGFGCGLFSENSLRAFVFYRDQAGEHEITLLMVDPASQREGLMSQLFKHYLVEIVKEKAVFLEVHEGNQAAISFYEKFGFKKTGERPNYYSGQGTAICMGRR